MSAAELLLKRLVEQTGSGAETGYVLVIDGEGLEVALGVRVVGAEPPP